MLEKPEREATYNEVSWKAERVVREVGGSFELDRAGTGKRASGAGKDTEMSEGDTCAESVMGSLLNDDDHSFSDTSVYCLLL